MDEILALLLVVIVPSFLLFIYGMAELLIKCYLTEITLEYKDK